MSTNVSRLVRVHEEVEKAFERKYFELSFDASLSRERRMSIAGIQGDPKIVSSAPSSARDVIRMGYFKLNIIKEEIPMALFRSPFNKPSRRPANLDFVFAFVEAWSAIAKNHLVVCTHTNIFYDEEIGLRVVGIEFLNGCFQARFLDRDPRVFYKDDLTLSIKE